MQTGTFHNKSQRLHIRLVTQGSDLGGASEGCSEKTDCQERLGPSPQVVRFSEYSNQRAISMNSNLVLQLVTHLQQNVLSCYPSQASLL